MDKEAHLPYIFRFLGVNRRQIYPFTLLPHDPDMPKKGVNAPGQAGDSARPFLRFLPVPPRLRAGSARARGRWWGPPGAAGPGRGERVGNGFGIRGAGEALRHRTSRCPVTLAARRRRRCCAAAPAPALLPAGAAAAAAPLALLGSSASAASAGPALQGGGQFRCVDPSGCGQLDDDACRPEHRYC